MVGSPLLMLFLSLAGICVHAENSLGVGAVGQKLFHLGSGLAVGRVCGSFLCEEGGVLGLQSLDRGEFFNPRSLNAFFAARCRSISCSCSAKYRFE